MGQSAAVALEETAGQLCSAEAVFEAGEHGRRQVDCGVLEDHAIYEVGVAVEGPHRSPLYGDVSEL